MNWKTAVIWTLAALNGLLLLSMVLIANPQPALAQGIGSNRSYVLIPMRYQSNAEALWVIDQAGRKVAMYIVDINRGIVEAIDGRDLDKDFRSRGEGKP